MRKVWLSGDARHVAGSRLLKECLLGGDVDIAPFSNCHPEGGTTEGSFSPVPVKILRLRLRICMR